MLAQSLHSASISFPDPQRFSNALPHTSSILSSSEHEYPFLMLESSRITRKIRIFNFSVVVEVELILLFVHSGRHTRYVCMHAV